MACQLAPKICRQAACLCSFLRLLPATVPTAQLPPNPDPHSRAPARSLRFSAQPLRRAQLAPVRLRERAQLAPVRLRARGLPMRARMPLAGVKITVKTRRATARRRPPTLLASVSRILPPPPPPPTGRCFVFPPFKPLPTYSPLLHPPPSSLPEDCCPGKELPLALAVPSSHLASSHGRDKSLGVFLIAIKVGSWVLLDWKSARVPAHPCPV